MRPLMLLALILACPSWSPSPAIRTVLGVPYVADGLYRHRLDLYLPQSPAAAPIVVFIHGGAFLSGDRRDYAPVGTALARQGIAVAIISYRLYPEADADGAAQDAARAVAFVAQHAAAFGLAPENLFIAGHSAGGHLAALLGTHARYLSAAGIAPGEVRGVITVAGAYDLRDLSGEPESWQTIDFHIYGQTQEARAAVSPGCDIDTHAIPISIVCGTADDPSACERAEYFSRALTAAGVWSSVSRVIGGDHSGVLRALITQGDPLNGDFHRFLATHASMTQKELP